MKNSNLLFTFYFILSTFYIGTTSLSSQEAATKIYPRLDAIPVDLVLATGTVTDTLKNGVIITDMEVQYYILVPLFYMADDSLYITYVDEPGNCTVIPMKYVKELKIFPIHLFNTKEIFELYSNKERDLIRVNDPRFK